MTARPVTPGPAESPGRRTDKKVSPVIAWSLWGLIVLTIFVSFRFYELNWYWYVLSHPGSVDADTLNETIAEILGRAAIPAYATVGAVVASLRPRNGVGWLCLALALILVVGEASWEMRMDWYNLRSFLELLNGLAWSLYAPPLPVTLMLLIYPTGRLLSRRWRIVVWMALSGTGLSIITEYLNRWAGVNVPGTLGPGIALIALLLSVVAVVVRWRRSEGRERQQIKWLVYAVGVTLIALLCALASWYIQDDIPGAQSYATLLASMIAFAGVALGIPLAIGIAVLKHRLYDIDVLINRTIVYGSLTAIVVGAYGLLVGSLSMLFQTGIGGNLTVSILIIGLTAVLIQPLWRRLQRGVNHLMYGERDEPHKVLARLGRRLEGTQAPDVALKTTVETIAQALKLPYAAITLAQDGVFVTAAEHGTPSGEPLVLPLTYGSETVGRLVLGPRSPGEAFTTSDLRALEDLARQVGVTAYAVRLTTDLQRSRERLVTAREEERRRLRRELHDGIGPQLAALTLKLETARNKLAYDPAADALLSDLAARARTAVVDVRRSVHALRPPALDELGLVPALRETVAQYGQSGLRISLEAPDNLPPLPAAVEVACYHIAQEAMTNVVRHSGANNCFVRLDLDVEAGLLHLQVEDDGRGIGPDRGTGVGLSSMRERAEELGGTCVVEPVETGGTRVRVELPCFLESAT
jgi:signal transduction histidine kinase